MEAELIVPDNVPTGYVESTLIHEHEDLCNNDDTDVYGKMGRTPATLLTYVCEKNKWEWSPADFDITLTLD